MYSGWQRIYNNKTTKNFTINYNIEFLIGILYFTQIVRMKIRIKQYIIINTLEGEILE